MNEAHKAYYAALAADEAYSAAIKRQFGKKKNRFDVDSADYNEETRKAYEAKVAADEKMNKAFV